MKKRRVLMAALSFYLVGCAQPIPSSDRDEIVDSNTNEIIVEIEPFQEIIELEEGLDVVEFQKDDLFNEFLAAKGASSDQEVVEFMMNQLMFDGTNVELKLDGFACSTIAVADANDNQYFGRNFDWKKSNAMIVISRPTEDYASISTVNMDFIEVSSLASVAMEFSDELKTMAAIYAPLDGMNEKGLTVAVNMIEDTDTINQNTQKPDITTTTAVRLLLNKAANVDEAIELLQSYDLHASMGWMVHFAISDQAGNSVVVEYIKNDMVVINTPIVTNFYLAEGDKKDVGSSQSHERFILLENQLQASGTLSLEEIKNSLDRVSKDNFNEFESTEWSIIFNKTTGEVRYYHRENYDRSYRYQLY